MFITEYWKIFQATDNEKKWLSERGTLLRDQADLQKLHDHLLQDYESLKVEKEAQKDTEKQLKLDLRKYQVPKYSTVQ